MYLNHIMEHFELDFQESYNNKLLKHILTILNEEYPCNCSAS